MDEPVVMGLCTSWTPCCVIHVCRCPFPSLKAAQSHMLANAQPRGTPVSLLSPFETPGTEFTANPTTAHGPACDDVTLGAHMPLHEPGSLSVPMSRRLETACAGLQCQTICSGWPHAILPGSRGPSFPSSGHLVVEDNAQ